MEAQLDQNKAGIGNETSAAAEDAAYPEQVVEKTPERREWACDPTGQGDAVSQKKRDGPQQDDALKGEDSDETNPFEDMIEEVRSAMQQVDEDGWANVFDSLGIPETSWEDVLRGQRLIASFELVEEPQNRWDWVDASDTQEEGRNNGLQQDERGGTNDAGDTPFGIMRRSVLVHLPENTAGRRGGSTGVKAGFAECVSDKGKQGIMEDGSDIGKFEHEERSKKTVFLFWNGQVETDESAPGMDTPKSSLYTIRHKHHAKNCNHEVNDALRAELDELQRGFEEIATLQQAVDSMVEDAVACEILSQPEIHKAQECLETGTEKLNKVVQALEDPTTPRKLAELSEELIYKFDDVPDKLYSLMVNDAIVRPCMFSASAVSARPVHRPSGGGLLLQELEELKKRAKRKPYRELSADVVEVQTPDEDVMDPKSECSLEVGKDTGGVDDARDPEA